jgi:hypothetical protein
VSISKFTAKDDIDKPDLSGSSAHKTSLLFALAVSSLLLGIVSGLRWPNIWAMTHYLFDYSNGFTKRGLTGEILTYVLGSTISYGTLVVLSFAIFVLWVLMLFWRLKVVAKIDYRMWLVAAVVLVSPGFVFLVHYVGYLDHVGLVVVLACFLMPATRTGLFGRTLLCGAMVITHEAFYLMFFPVVVLEFMIRAMLAGFRRQIAGTFLLVGVVAALTFVVGQSSLPSDQRAAYTSHVADRAIDFQIRPDAVQTLFRDARDNIRISSDIQRKILPWNLLLIGTIFFLPLPIGFVLASLHMVRRSLLPDHMKLYLRLAIGVSAFSPLLLNIVAWDTWRFFALTQFSAFMVFLTIGTHLRMSAWPNSWTRPIIYILLILVVMGATVNLHLLDSYNLAGPPYLPNISPIVDVLSGEIRIPSR